MFLSFPFPLSKKSENETKREREKERERERGRWASNTDHWDLKPAIFLLGILP